MMNNTSKVLNFFKNGRVLAAFTAVTLCLLALVYFYEKSIMLPKERVQKYNEAYQAYMYQNDPTAYQNLFTKDINSNTNDAYTKLGAYLIFQRYFNNGGDIYEVFNYVDQHKELSFLKDAEGIYPKVFNQIKNKRLPFTYSDEGMYAYLAYLEMLDRYGYADVATTGTLAGQYAKMAYYKKMILEDKASGRSLEYPNYTQKNIEADTTKSIFFVTKVDDTITKVLNNSITSKEVPPRDILIGVTQYASALRYLESLGVTTPQSMTSGEVFAFAISFAHKYVPDLYLFTSLSNASTLLLVPSTNNELRNAVYPFFDFNSKLTQPTGLIQKMLDAKFERSISRFSDLNVYSKKNIVALANKVPEFKTWLRSSGWTKNDFK